MRVSNLKISQRRGRCEFSASVKCDTFWVWGNKPFRLWYQFPAGFAPYLDEQNGDPFVAALLAPAMVLGERLEIDAEVSPQLLQSVSKIQKLYRNWFPALKEIPVEARPRRAGINLKTSGEGLFFSLGADSFYSLLKQPESISHLITVEGFDVYLWEQARYPAVLENFNRVARELGKTPIHVKTNLREFSDRMADWVDLYHGAALASVALSLPNLFQRIRIAATHNTRELMPLGSHPSLDYLWSTESLTFTHDGAEASRLQKLRSIAKSSLALQTLRVCAISTEAAIYNCGTCPKCLMTMVGLHVAGALERCVTLPAQVDPELLGTISVTNATQRVYLEELAGALGDSATDLSIKHALDQCLGRAERYEQVA